MKEKIIDLFSMGLLTNYVASNFRMPQTANQLVKYFWNRMLEYFSVNFFVGFWRDLPHSIKRKINFYVLAIPSSGYKVTHSTFNTVHC